jgi:hypothetical protein
MQNQDYNLVLEVYQRTDIVRLISFETCYDTGLKTVCDIYEINFSNPINSIANFLKGIYVEGDIPVIKVMADCTNRDDLDQLNEVEINFGKIKTLRSMIVRVLERHLWNCK